jgi:hypothetical protein
VEERPRHAVGKGGSSLFPLIGISPRLLGDALVEVPGTPFERSSNAGIRGALGHQTRSTMRKPRVTRQRDCRGRQTRHRRGRNCTPHGAGVQFGLEETDIRHPQCLAGGAEGAQHAAVLAADFGGASKVAALSVTGLASQPCWLWTDGFPKMATVQAPGSRV